MRNRKVNMIEHQVWFKLRDGWTPEDAATLKRELLALQSKIDGISYAAAGLDISGRSRGFEFGYIARFATRAAYEAYGPHPEHDAFIAANKHIWQDVMALDYSIED